MLDKVYIVWEFCDLLDSVWTTEQRANDRVTELNTENGPGFARIEIRKVNTPYGFLGHA